MLDQQVLGTSHNLGSGDFATEGFSKVVVSNMEMDTDLFQQDICIYIYTWDIHSMEDFHICMFQILAKKRIPRESCFFPLPEWVGQVIHVFILLSSHPIVGGLGWWGNSGKSPRLTNSWIGWSQLMETPQPKTPIGGCNCFLKGTKTRDPPVWNPPPPIDANEFVLVRSYESLLFCFIVRVWPLSHDIMYLHHWLCILESTIHNLRSFPQGLFRICGWAALMWTRDWEMLKKKSPWTSEAPPCDGCGKNSTKCASNFRNSNASKGV